MTEYKRFTHKKWHDERQLFDYDKPFAIVDVNRQAENICNKLNELHEENQQLKVEREMYIHKAQSYRKQLEFIANQLESFSRVPALEHAVDNWRNQTNLMTKEYVKLNNKYREECHNESIIKKTKGDE